MLLLEFASYLKNPDIATIINYLIGLIDPKNSPLVDK